MEDYEIRNNDPKYKKKRKLIIWGGLAALAICITLIAIFFTQPKAVSFSTGLGKKIDNIIINRDGYITAPSDPTRYGWDFGGWYSDENFTVKIEDISKYQFKKSTTVYAKWYLHRYKVTYVLNGGTLGNSAPAEYVIKHEKAEDETWAYDFDIVNGLPVPNPDRMMMNVPLIDPTHNKNYTFDGWYDNPEGTGNRITELNVTDPKDITLYAIWIK